MYKITADGGAAINQTYVVPSGQYRQLVSVTLHLSSAPTTAGNLVISLDAAEGAEYDTALYKVDPSATSLTDLFWQPDQTMILSPGDAVDVLYANADSRVYGLVITLRGA